jgi:hypothetical protein
MTPNVSKSPRMMWRRILFSALVGCVAYFLSAGPVTRYAPEFADGFYAPLGLMADIPLAGSVLRGWLSLWGVNVS